MNHVALNDMFGNVDHEVRVLLMSLGVELSKCVNFRPMQFDTLVSNSICVAIATLMLPRGDAIGNMCIICPLTHVSLIDLGPLARTACSK